MTFAISHTNISKTFIAKTLILFVTDVLSIAIFRVLSLATIFSPRINIYPVQDSDAVLEPLL